MARVIRAGCCFALLSAWITSGAKTCLADPPRVLDKRLVIEQIAATPDIVTPTGLAVDARGRVLVVESHTHFRPHDYAGPEADRIRLIDDADGDGRPERVRTFFEGSRFTMNIAVARDGAIFVATRAAIFRLRDTNGDDTADENVSLAKLETAGDYPHNGLSGFAFDFDDNVYFGLGENLGASYRLIGSDGAALEGGGEGGNIYRCRPDGSGLVRVATGFWNPFHVACDAFDRLYAVDNDPDSRPPCRLLHIVPDGDYGYRYRNGRKGVHPFTAWNGELPGTLPMMAGTGEAPSGVLVYEHELLPAEYFGTLLETSWGDHRIERFQPERQGASFRATAEPIVTGGDDFRPVGIALAPDGSLFVSDWVDKSYDLHGQGRVWRIRPTSAELKPSSSSPTGEVAAEQALHSRIKTVRETTARELAAGDNAQRATLVEAMRTAPDDRVRATAYQALRAADRLSADDVLVVLSDRSPDLRALALRTLPAEALNHQQAEKLATSDEDAEVRAAALSRLNVADSGKVLRGALVDSDPFIRTAALRAIHHTGTFADWHALAQSTASAERIAGALLVREAADDPRRPEVLARLCNDAEPTIRFAAVQGVGEARLSALRPLLIGLLLRPGSSRELFEGCLASLERLAGDTRSPSDEIAGEQFVLSLLNQEGAAAPLRIRALRMLRPDHPALQIERLKELQDGANNEPDLALEIVRTLRERPEPERLAMLRKIASDGSQAERLRAEAIMGLVPEDAACRELLWRFARGSNVVLRDEALRALAGVELSEAEAAELAKLDKGNPHVARLVARVRSVPSVDAARISNPSHELIDIDAWLTRLAEEGSPEVGERIFFHLRGAGCWKCHQIEGRGRAIGPELSSIGSARDRRRLLESLVDPSREIAPQFVPWTIETSDGLVRTGVLVSETIPVPGQQSAVQQQYVAPDGATFLLNAEDVVRREPSRQSIMPSDVVHNLSDSELADLLAYLSSRR